jgi:hypothetical protein
VIHCIASMGAAAQSNPPGTFTKPQGFGGTGSRSSSLTVRVSFSGATLFEIFGGENFEGGGRNAGRGDNGVGDGDRWSGGANPELSKEQEMLRTLQRWHRYGPSEGPSSSSHRVLCFLHDEQA